MRKGETNTRPAPTATELAVLDASAARGILAAELGPPSDWEANPMIEQLLANECHADWQAEAGRWLSNIKNAEARARVIRRVRGARQPPDAENPAHRFFYSKFFAELAPPMASYYFARTGWKLLDIEPEHNPAGSDVDAVLASPAGAKVFAQVKAPDLPPEDRAGIHHRAGNDDIVLSAMCKGLSQLPAESSHPAMLVLSANRLIELTYRPDPVELTCVGSTTTLADLDVTVLFEKNRGGFLVAPDVWARCGAVVLLDLARWTDDPRYHCTVFINPNSGSGAACDPSWFPSANVCVVDGDQLRWLDGAKPEASTIPDGTRIVRDD